MTAAWHDSEEARDRAARRERLLRQSLQDVMTLNGLPRGWLGCAVLPGLSRSGRAPGFHVQLVVSGGWDVLKKRLHELEEAFRECACALDANAREWILSIAWVLDEPQHAPAHPGWMIRPNAEAAAVQQALGR